MKNLNLKHHFGLWMQAIRTLSALVVCIPLLAFANGFPEVPRPIDTAPLHTEAYTDSCDSSCSDLTLAPLSLAKAKGNRHLGKALREIGRIDLTGTALSGAALASSGMPSGRLDMATLEEPLGGQFDSGVLEQRGLENGGKFETNGFETPLKGWFSSNPEVPVTFKHRHPVRR